MRGVVVAVGAMLGSAVVGARDGSMFEIEGEPGARVIVTAAVEPPGADARGGVLGGLDGVLAVRGKPEVAKLRGCEPRRPAGIGRPRDGETVCFVRVVDEGGARVVEIGCGSGGLVVAEEQG